MENLPRNLRRYLTSFPSPASKGRPRQWTLLLIETRGKVISLGNLKTISITGGVSLLLILIITAMLFILYTGEKRRNTALQAALSDSEELLMPLRDERDILMARLEMADAQVEVLRSRTKKLQAGTAGKASAGKGSERADEGTSQVEKTKSVSVDNFKIFYNPDLTELKVKFRVNNILDTNEPVSGFIFVACGENKSLDDKVLTMPEVAISSGKPVDIDRGRYFLISRFNDIEFTTVVESSLEHYKYAIVFVYSKTGELLLEKTHPFRIEGKSSA